MISPFFANLMKMKLPPAIFTCGTLDPLLDDSVCMSAKWMMSGAEAVLKIYPGMVAVVVAVEVCRVYTDLSQALRMGLCSSRPVRRRRRRKLWMISRSLWTGRSELGDLDRQQAKRNDTPLLNLLFEHRSSMYILWLHLRVSCSVSIVIQWLERYILPDLA